MGYVDHPIALVVLALASWPFYRALGTLIFRNADDLHNSIYYWLMPDFISLFRGEWWEDQFASLKLLAFVSISGLTVGAEYAAVTRIIAWVSGGADA